MLTGNTTTYQNTHYKKYAAVIAFALQDLGLENVNIELTFGKAGGGITGYHQIVVNPANGEMSHIVRVSPGFMYKITIDTILHELRHVWQVYNRDYSMYGADTTVWEGIKYRALKESDADYNNQPWELDAIKYAKKSRKQFY